jgi:DNA-binding CsgD family transcriptional regulator
LNINRLKTLTPRENEVLNEVVSGRRNREIANELGITIRTVKEYRGRIMEKMEANSFAELITMIVTVRLIGRRLMLSSPKVWESLGLRHSTAPSSKRRQKSASRSCEGPHGSKIAC